MDTRLNSTLSSYPELDSLSKIYERSRWVPCNKNNKPLNKWSEVRCTYNEAHLWPGREYMAENLRNCRWIVIDFDCDHDKDRFDIKLWNFGLNLLENYPTACWFTEGYSSFHLTYLSNVAIPTYHFKDSKIDICGNANNQLRYFKNKINNGKEMVYLTDGIWRELINYLESDDK